MIAKTGTRIYTYASNIRVGRNSSMKVGAGTHIAIANGIIEVEVAHVL